MDNLVFCGLLAIYFAGALIVACIVMYAWRVAHWMSYGFSFPHSVRITWDEII
jgi:hypothetical protein